MNILVTGASGFLGQFLVPELHRRGYRVFSPGRCSLDLSSWASVRNYWESFTDEIDYIFHLAAWTQAGDFCLKHRGEQFVQNQLINTHALMMWKEFSDTSRFVLLGTSCAYDSAYGYAEDSFLDGTPEESLFTYAYTKRMLLEGARAFHDQFGMNYHCMVPATLYGPGYHQDGRQMHFIFDLVRKICDAKYLGTPVSLWGDGSQIRELIHVDDFVEGMLRIVENDLAVNQVVNISEGVGCSITEFATEIASQLNFDPSKIKYDRSRYVGSAHKVLDGTLFRSLSPDFNFKPISSGISEVIEWYCASRKYFDRLS